MPGEHSRKVLRTPEGKISDRFETIAILEAGVMGDLFRTSNRFLSKKVVESYRTMDSRFPLCPLLPFLPNIHSRRYNFLRQVSGLLGGNTTSSYMIA